MHIPTHILSGWCVAGLVPGLTARDRLLCMVAATAPDLDGLGILFGREAYWDYHHVLGHSLAFAVVAAAVLAAFSVRKWAGFAVYLALAHLHFLMDYWGSGPGWGIAYGWPFLKPPAGVWMNPAPWEFDGWQNKAAAAAFLIWTLLIVRLYRRTPLEWPMPGLDRHIAQILFKSEVAASRTIAPSSGQPDERA